MKLIVSLLFTLFMVSCASQGTNKFSPLLNGQQVPTSIVKTTDDKNLNILDELKKKPTVLIFYRGGWCPYCNKQLERIRKVLGKINKLGYQIIAVSPDKPQKLKESVDKLKLNYTLISDSDLTLAKNFGLSFKVDDETVERYKKWNINLEEASGKKHHSLPVPAVYVIDTKGLVHFNYINPNYKVRLNENILMSALKELKLD